MQLAHLAELGAAFDRAHGALQVRRDLATLRLERGKLRRVQLAHLVSGLGRGLGLRLGVGVGLGLVLTWVGFMVEPVTKDQAFSSGTGLNLA